MEWISVKEDLPQYYSVNLCYGNNSTATCWRANDGDKDIYTIAGTDNIMQNITHWMPLPPLPKD